MPQGTGRGSTSTAGMFLVTYLSKCLRSSTLVVDRQVRLARQVSFCSSLGSNSGAAGASPPGTVTCQHCASAHGANLNIRRRPLRRVSANLFDVCRRGKSWTPFSRNTEGATAAPGRTRKPEEVSARRRQKATCIVIASLCLGQAMRVAARCSHKLRPVADPVSQACLSAPRLTRVAVHEPRFR